VPDFLNLPDLRVLATSQRAFRLGSCCGAVGKVTFHARLVTASRIALAFAGLS
jgi:hypothetical protein